MSDFGYYKVVKTKKVHRCITCNRSIPSGKKAFHFHGMWENDWQNHYICIPCEDLDVLNGNEEIGGDEFNEWVYNSEHLECSKCKGLENGMKYGYRADWDWDKNEEKMLMECMVCGHKWELFIGFDGKEEE